MPEFSDIHCHLFAGIDDGPRDLEEAVEMCRLAVGHQTRFVAGVAHFHPQWPASTRESILQQHRRLADRLKAENLPIEVVPSCEALIQPDLLELLDQNRLVTVGDHGKALLVELPPMVNVNLTQLFRRLVRKGIAPILAHPERYNHLIDEIRQVEAIVESGGLLQVNASSILDSTPRRAKQIREWFDRKMVHFVASDGHRINKRLPVVDDAYRTVVEWIGQDLANQIFCENGRRIIEGRSVSPPPVLPPRKRFWFF